MIPKQQIIAINPVKRVNQVRENKCQIYYLTMLTNLVNYLRYGLSFDFFLPCVKTEILDIYDDFPYSLYRAKH